MRWLAVNRGLYRLQFAAVLMAWPVLFVISRQAGFASGPAGTVLGTTLSAVIATVPVVLLAVLLFRPDWQPRNSNLMVSNGALFACFVAAGLAVAAVIGAYDQHALPTTGGWSWALLGTLAIPLTLFCYFAINLIVNSLWWWQLRRLIRKDCPLAVLDVLLAVFDNLRDPLCPSSWSALESGRSAGVRGAADHPGLGADVLHRLPGLGRLADRAGGAVGRGIAANAARDGGLSSPYPGANRGGPRA